MQRIKFLFTHEVILINKHQIEAFGGLFGIRDKNFLSSAVHAPQSTFHKQYLYQSKVEMAAAYIFSIIKNHPFLDGNKRTGIISGLLFLEYNKIQIQLSQSEFFDLAIDVAKNNLSIQEIASVLEKSKKV